MKCLPLRYLMMLIMFLGTINLYSQRMCLSIAVLCMTNHTAGIKNNRMSVESEESKNSTVGVCGISTYHSNNQLKDGPFEWDGQTRAYVLGVFFWGYLAGQIPAGFITQKFGARWVNLIGLILLGISTGLIPLVALYSIYLLYVLRIIAGLASAFWFPGFYQIWASWAPPNERGLLVGLSNAGVHVGNAMTLPIAGALCHTSIGWPLIFYFYGAASLAYALVWVVFVYNTPSEHPQISDKEKKFIVSLCGDSGRMQKRESGIPIVAMLKSLPVWAFVVLTVGYDWNGYTMLTSMPVYMKEVLMFDINENAGLSSIPYIGLWFGQVMSGWLSDNILKRKLLTVNVMRKLMTAIGMFGSGLMLILISFFDCREKYVVVGLFTLGLVLNSGVFAGGMLNPIEISPKHAGIIFAGANTLGALTGVFAPLLVSVLTPHQMYSEWRYVFYVGAAIYMSSGAVFVLCSSSKVQKWGTNPKDYWSSGDQTFQVLPDGNPKRLCHSEPTSHIYDETKISDVVNPKGIVRKNGSLDMRDSDDVI